MIADEITRMAEYQATCPRCSRTLAAVEKVPLAVSCQFDPPTVPGRFDVYLCPEHGYWRIYASGEMEKVTTLGL